MLSLDSYSFNYYSIPNILVSAIIFSTGFFVFIQNPAKSQNLFFFLLCVSLNLWLLGRVLMYCSKDAAQALLIARRFAFLGVAYIAPTVYSFSAHWLNKYKKQKFFIILGLVGSAVFYILFNLTPYGIREVRHYFWGYYPVYGWMGKLYLVFFFAYFFAAFYNFFSELKVEEDSAKRKQIQLIAIAFIISCTASWDYIPKVINVALYPFGFAPVLAWILMIGYCIVKYRALDIQTVIHKTILWFASTIVAMIPFVILLYLSNDWMRSTAKPIATAYLLTLLIGFYFYFQFLQPRLSQLLRLRSANLERTKEAFARRLTHLNNLRTLLQRLVRTLRRTIYPEKVAVFLLDREKGMLVPAIVKGARGLHPISLGEPYVQWFEKKNRVLVTDLAMTDPETFAFKEEMQKHFETMDAEVVIPFILGGKLIGLVYLGRKENLKRYNSLEVSFLNDLSASVTIAISNSMRLEDVSKLYKEVQALNEGLEQRVQERTKELVETQGQLIQAEKLATLGTLAGGVAHEINNPLTAVLTNAQILKMSASEEDAELIDLIEQGAKRCQAVTKKLLKYSRKEQDDAHSDRIDLNHVTKNVVNFLKYQLEQEGVNLSVDLAATNALIWGNENELEQVLTNLLLNARDATKTKEEGGHVGVRLTTDSTKCYLEINDNGIGMSQEILNKIFDPFYTTKEVGSGTGLGLSVTQSIVQKHQGNIIVKSKENKGTSFVLEFPKGVK